MRKNRNALRLGLAVAAAMAGGVPAAHAVTTVNQGSVNVFTGPGGLDLSGNFAYAINFSNNDPDLVLNGVTFKHDRQVIPGATLTGPNEVTPWAATPNFGATADDDTLEQIMADIRWANSGANQILQADLAVTPGRQYKLQTLFYGNQSENRRWDILFEGALAVDNVTSLGLDGIVPYAGNQGAVFTHTFTAADATMSIIFDGRNGAGTGGANGVGDPNPIWQALTLEDVTPPVPEPATFALLGLASLGLLRRRQRADA